MTYSFDLFSSGDGPQYRLLRLRLAQVAEMVEAAGLQIGAGSGNFRQRRLRQDFGRDVPARGIGDFVDEADVPVLAGGDARDHLAPGDLGIDDGLASAPAVVDHHDEILHMAPALSPRSRRLEMPALFPKIGMQSRPRMTKIVNWRRRWPRTAPGRSESGSGRFGLTCHFSAMRDFAALCAPPGGLARQRHIWPLPVVPTLSFFGHAQLCRLAGPAGRLGSQTPDLALRQGDADLPDPVQL